MLAASRTKSRCFLCSRVWGGGGELDKSVVLDDLQGDFLPVGRIFVKLLYSTSD